MFFESVTVDVVEARRFLRFKPHPEEFVGKNMRATHEKIMDGGEAGWEEVTGVDGITRIFGYVPPSLPPKDFFLSIGEAKAEGFSAIDSATWRGAALILAGLWAAIYVAWAGRRLVSSPPEGLFWAALTNNAHRTASVVYGLRTSSYQKQSFEYREVALDHLA